ERLLASARQRGRPKLVAATEIDVVTDLKRRIVEGLAILTGEGIMDGAGHLSARIPGTDTFLINPRFPGILADPDDICTVDLNAKRIGGRGPIPSESIIHAILYRDRPDVQSVVHCHARYSILVSLLDSGLIPFSRTAASFDGVPVFPESHGINTPALAERFIRSIGDKAVALLQGHGIVATGPTVEGACINGLNLEKASQDQITMMSFTTPKPLAGRALGQSNERLENPYRMWPYLLNKHGIRPRAAIKASIHSLPEGEHY
ncbi:MAG: mtnB 2, partial [Chloroflexi bacterium]|nr:mtnB 2 [Chloroflexota bacterium]